MKKFHLLILAVFTFGIQSCMKTYTCTCPDPTGGMYHAGSMSAVTKAEAQRGCRAMGQDEGCTAQLR